MYLLTLTSAQRITYFNSPLILDYDSIMVVMQKLNRMQEFTSAIDVECLHSNLQAKLPMHGCTRAKHAQTCFLANKGF